MIEARGKFKYSFSTAKRAQSWPDLTRFGNWSSKKKSAQKYARNYKTDDSILLDVSPWNLQNKPDLRMCRRIISTSEQICAIIITLDERS